MSSLSDLPHLSIVVIIHNMPVQAWNTVQSLLPEYQAVQAQHYEVVLVENASDNSLPAEQLSSLPDNFHYYRREETGVSPAAAINFGLAKARAPLFGLMIDGARMLSPGVLARVLDAAAAYPDLLVNVPGYYLTQAGSQADGDDDGRIVQHEQQLLRSLRWQEDGYCLFEQAVFSNGNRHGYLRPFMESTALFCNRWAVDQIGGADESFQQPGGGALLLHMFRTLGMIAKLDYLVLPGEGNFHQFHGGVSTRSGAQRDELVRKFKEELDSYWPGGFKALSRESILFGSVPEPALPFLQQSCSLATERATAFARNGKPIWPDDDALGFWHGDRHGE